MIQVLITGSNGQLGSEFRAIAHQYPHFSLTFTDIPDLDLTSSGDMEDYFSKHSFDVVINCAAYTAVDKAEDDPVSAMKVNRDAVAFLSQVCSDSGSYLIQVSTDYIFNGKSDRPYREDDNPDPLSVYGHSKLAGEEAMMSCLSTGMIIRTSWLYSSFGNNFVRTVLKKARETGIMNIVSDQYGNPTYARNLAETILHILPGALPVNELQILHYSNDGICNWYEFARAITELAGITCKLVPITTADYPAKAQRPMYSPLDKRLIREKYGIAIPDWKESLRECIRLIEQGN